ncbi:unnamed protein product [Parajaminaea phylloscopi]
MVTNNRLVLLQEPQGVPELDRDFAYDAVEIDLDADLKGNGLLLKPIAISLDPTLRNSMRLSVKKPYAPLFKKGEPIWGFGIAEVVKSQSDQWKKGDLAYSSYTRMSNYYEISAADLESGNWTKIEPQSDLNITTYLGALGMPGSTAWMSLAEYIGETPKPNSTMFVTSAAGIVGQIVCQLAKAKGIKVIASAGSESKVEFLEKQLGVDRAFNYKTADVDAELADFGGPDGVTYMFDNVGGKQLNSYIAHSAVHGVIIVCGVISGYNAQGEPTETVPNFPMGLLYRQLSLHGFIVSSLTPKWREAFLKAMPAAIRDGTVKSREDIRYGLNALAPSFVDLMTGNHDGKVVVLVDAENKDKWIKRNPDGFSA